MKRIDHAEKRRTLRIRRTYPERTANVSPGRERRASSSVLGPALKYLRIAAIAVAGAMMACSPLRAGSRDLGQYNVVWDSPSVDASGQMPLGNGDIAAGVYAIGALVLTILYKIAITVKEAETPPKPATCGCPA